MGACIRHDLALTAPRASGLDHHSIMGIGEDDRRRCPFSVQRKWDACSSLASLDLGYALQKSHLLEKPTCECQFATYLKQVGKMMDRGGNTPNVKECCPT